MIFETGDEVEALDEVIFELIKQEGSFLHCSALPATHLSPFETSGTKLYEGSVGSLTGWKLSLYRQSGGEYYKRRERASRIWKAL